MNRRTSSPPAGETELKLLLTGVIPADIVRQLSRLPLLARRTARTEQLVNRYFDTPDGDLRQRHCALRLRRIQMEGQARARWVQTFKTAGHSGGGLSKRGEWEAPVTGARLQRAALGDAPWADMDPDGHLWDQLQPVFETRCQRTIWTVRRRDGTEVEVALDLGDIQAAGQRLAVAELELELKDGSPDALFELALNLGEHLPLLPGQISKAERGHALLSGQAHAPTRARPVALAPDMPPREAAPLVLGEMWDQVLRNLAALLHSNQPEVVHQARVAWRRLRGALRLFRPVIGSAPPLQGLRPLWDALGPVRELDVAIHDTLPPWRDAFMAGNAQRAAAWSLTTQSLRESAHRARALAREALAQPAVGHALISLARWLAALAHEESPKGPDTSRNGNRRLDEWAVQRLGRLQRRLDKELSAAQGQSQGDEHLHQARLLAKRLRYNTEALAGVLPRRRAARWRQQAAELQALIGDERDLVQVVHWLAQHDADAEVLSFMRGVVAARLQLHAS